MLAIRDSQNEWEEDGIWHDDGSRQFAISLSLNEFPETIEGGKLGFRKKGEEKITLIPTPKFGEMIVFLSGIHGYEHRTHQVTKGRRIILVGWFS
jgi:Rps23 Pro-64 3,4-dihydroxylase Tpa1-like proline 4-hydroxylase